MKAALLEAHYLSPKNGNPNCLFEPYAAILKFEFCVGVYSVAEGLGAAHSLVAGKSSPSRGQWKKALCNYVNSQNTRFAPSLESVMAIRDLIHQDRAGQRSNIDWHEFALSSALLPAASVLSGLFDSSPSNLPEKSNLIAFEQTLASLSKGIE